MKIISIIIFYSILVSITYCKDLALTVNPANYCILNFNIGVEMPVKEKESVLGGIYAATIMVANGYGMDMRYRWYTEEGKGFYAGPYLSYYRLQKITFFSKEKSDEYDNGVFIGMELGYKHKLSERFDLSFGIIPIYNYTFSPSKTYQGGAFFMDVARVYYTFK